MREINLPINIKTVILFAIILLGYSCKLTEPVITAKPVVTIQSADSVTKTSAVMVAYVVPNGDASVSFQYKALSDANWTSSIASGKYSGTKAVRVSFGLSNLLPGTTYNYKVTAVNAIGSVTPDQMISFTTIALDKAVAVIKPATNVTRYEATLNATIVSNQPNTKVTFKYWTDAETTPKTKILPTLYNGTDSINVSADVNGLPLNTKIYYQVEVDNQAGSVVSDKSSFTTYAVSDYDGNLYHTVTIGTQTWLRENLKTTHYANGDPIPNVTDTTAWLHSTSGAYVYYNNDPKLGEVYGCLYNWYVTNDSRGLIVGYHVPSSHEWVTLGNFIRAQNSGSAISGFAMMEKGTSHWISSAGTNSTGFTALPNGEYGISDVTNKWEFMNLGNIATFWCSDSLGKDSEVAEIDPFRISMLDIGIMFSKNRGKGIRLLEN